MRLSHILNQFLPTDSILGSGGGLCFCLDILPLKRYLNEYHRLDQEDYHAAIFIAYLDPFLEAPYNLEIVNRYGGQSVFVIYQEICQRFPNGAHIAESLYDYFYHFIHQQVEPYLEQLHLRHQGVRYRNKEKVAHLFLNEIVVEGNYIYFHFS